MYSNKITDICYPSKFIASNMLYFQVYNLSNMLSSKFITYQILDILTLTIFQYYLHETTVFVDTPLRWLPFNSHRPGTDVLPVQENVNKSPILTRFAVRVPQTANRLLASILGSIHYAWNLATSLNVLLDRFRFVICGRSYLDVCSFTRMLLNYFRIIFFMRLW